MGLDNGIILECPDEDFKKIPYYDEDEIGIRDKHLAYWRKCWGVRGAIMAVLHAKDNEDTPIEAEDVPALIRALKPFLSRDYWDEEADSIWEYDDYFDLMYEKIIRLEWLKEYLKEHPDTKCYFYDSY